MKLIGFATVLLVCLSVLSETHAQLGMTASSCRMNVIGCPNALADTKCNKCCRRSGCDRGDCDHYNCKCRGCPYGK